MNNLCINIFELNFYQDQRKCRHKLIPIEISKNDESGRIVYLLIYKTDYALIKKIIVFLGDHHKNFICRRCLNSYTIKNKLMIREPKCENYDITTISIPSESHLLWKNHFHKNPLYFKIYADFEADNGINISVIGFETTNI